jgi:hypothetical protein
MEGDLEPMQAYKKETRKVVKRFLRYDTGLPRCIAALDASLADFVPRMTAKDLPELRAFVLANNETIMKEMERRRGASQTK